MVSELSRCSMVYHNYSVTVVSILAWLNSLFVKKKKSKFGTVIYSLQKIHIATKSELKWYPYKAKNEVLIPNWAHLHHLILLGSQFFKRLLNFKMSVLVAYI